jgi:hypothetical protein
VFESPGKAPGQLAPQDRDLGYPCSDEGRAAVVDLILQLGHVRLAISEPYELRFDPFHVKPVQVGEDLDG